MDYWLTKLVGKNSYDGKISKIPNTTVCLHVSSGDAS